MNIERERVNVDLFTLTLQTNYETGDNETLTFSNIIKKLVKECSTKGFKKSIFNKEEIKLIEELSEIFVPDEENKNSTLVNLAQPELPRHEEKYNEEELEE